MNAVQEIKWWKASRPKDMGEFGATVCILSLIHISEPTRPY